jgi:hypothetical protein
MSFRKTLAFSTFLMSTATIFSAPAQALADERRRQQTEGDAGYAPIQSIAYEFGSKAMSGHFVPQGSVCLVTLMISDRSDRDRPSPATAARVRLVLEPGQIAGLERGGPLAQLDLPRRREDIGRELRRKVEACGATRHRGRRSGSGATLAEWHAAP